MTLVPGLLRAVRHSCARQIQRPPVVRAFSTNPPSGTSDSQTTNTFESADDFQRRIFGDIPGGNSRSYKFFQQLDKTEKAHDRSGFGSKLNLTKGSDGLDGVDESFNRINILSDGMNAKLKEAATYFEYDPNEIESDYYTYRPDMPFRTATTYETKDLDLTKPGTRKIPKRLEFETTTEEVLRKADFRNVRFLANFITEAGVIIKRSKTKISAKAQRKVAREIKTARAFGLMPFTTMGTKQFVFGNTMENLDKDYEYETHDSYNFVDDNRDPLDS